MMIGHFIDVSVASDILRERFKAVRYPVLERDHSD
jgi:hypothetical protein